MQIFLNPLMIHYHEIFLYLLCFTVMNVVLIIIIVCMHFLLCNEMQNDRIFTPDTSSILCANFVYLLFILDQ